ncbi:MAG: hypothetical protein WBW74_27830 [Xanthobacteraceae bacterium]
MDQASNDVATLLVDEFDAWFRSLGACGFIPRAFTGVTKGGKQAVIILTGLPLDHVQQRDFLIWLCRAEQFESYAYGSHVGIIDGDSTIGEGVEFCASSRSYDVRKMLGIDRTIDGKCVFFDQHYTVLPAPSKNGAFVGLQRSTEDILSADQELFDKLWCDKRPNVLWRQR